MSKYIYIYNSYLLEIHSIFSKFEFEIFFHLWQFQILNLMIVINDYDCFVETWFDPTNYLTMKLVWKQNIYIYCRRTNETTMLNLADHDSMSGEHIGSNSGLIVTSGKSGIWPLAAPKNYKFRRLWKFPREGKSPRQINKIAYVRR